MHGRTFHLRELRCGFEPERFCIRLDSFAEALADLNDAEFRVTVQANSPVTIMAKISQGKLVEYAVEQDRICLLKPSTAAEVAFEQILEIAIRKDLLHLKAAFRLRLGVALWHSGLPVDVSPPEAHPDLQPCQEY